MPASPANPKVDAFLARATKWQAEITKLRTIMLDCGLTEEVKWGKPCYTFQDANVVLILPFKDTCALLFTKGALLKDSHGFLIQPTENTQGARQARFTSAKEITAMAATLKAYVKEAMELEKAGLKVAYKKPAETPVPEELQAKLDELPEFKAAFKTLTPGRQRAYILHFSSAKQSQTRVSRIEKCIPQILEGKGWNEEYRTGSK